MKKLLSSLLLAAAATAAVPSTASADPTTIVTNAVNHYEATRAFKGAVVVVVDHGYYYWYNYGWRSNTDGISITTPVAIASNTKTFVATSLALTDAYTSTSKDTQLHSLISINSGSPPYHATLADLVDYFSGLPRDTPSIETTRSDLYATLSHCGSWSDPCFAPETTSVYSNYGFQVLGNVLAQIWGTSQWSDLNAQQVTGPLGMTKTCARGDGCHPNFDTSHAHAFDFWGNELSLPAHNSVIDPEGGLWTTAEDMAIWLRYQLGFIPASTPELAQLDAVLPTMRQKLPSGSGWSWKFSQLTFSDGVTSKVRWKLGRWAGLNSYIGLCDSRQTGVFVFVNRDGSDPSVEDPSDVLRDELGETILEQFP
jgi:CubicO group peptidase (beta-lactamase class C family)